LVVVVVPAAIDVTLSTFYMCSHACRYVKKQLVPIARP